MRWHIGTSGWGYKSWEGTFYPKGLKATDRLAHYARYFDAVEINNSFYHLPKREQITRWQQNVPADFTFAVKGSRFISHNKKLTDPEETIANMMQPLHHQSKVSAIIFQLPPNLGQDMERLENFLEALPKQRFAIEFRNPEWHTEEVYQLLEKYNVAFCLFEKGKQYSPRVVTADFVYLRLHGRKAGYRGCYSDEALADWHDWIARQRKDAYVFFDNTDEKLHAIDNALTFRNMANIRISAA